MVCGNARYCVAADLVLMTCANLERPGVQKADYGRRAGNALRCAPHYVDRSAHKMRSWDAIQYLQQARDIVMETVQSPLIDGLMNPAIYRHLCSKVDLVETHISWVLPTGLRAYKIKKPVDLGFVNFTTLKSRKYFCEEELRLNRRLAPEL